MAPVGAPVGAVERRGPVEEVRPPAVGPASLCKKTEYCGELDRGPVDHRGIDDLPGAGRARLDECRADAEREQQAAAAHVADKVQGYDGVAVGGSDRTESSCNCDVVDVVPRLAGERTFLPPSGHPPEHEPGPAPQACLRAEPETLDDAGPEAFDHRVGAVDQPQRDVDARGALQSDRDGAAASVRSEEHTSE